MESQKQTRSIPLPFEISNFKSVILGCCAPSRLYFTPSVATIDSSRSRGSAALVSQRPTGRRVAAENRRPKFKS